MCGITGALWFDSSAAVAQATLDAMTDAITHRGPDDRGTYLSPLKRDVTGNTPGIALGFRRLSIIDLAGGHQPMTNEDARSRSYSMARSITTANCVDVWKVPATASAPTAIQKRSSTCTKTWGSNVLLN